MIGGGWFIVGVGGKVKVFMGFVVQNWFVSIIGIKFLVMLVVFKVIFKFVQILFKDVRNFVFDEFKNWVCCELMCGVIKEGKF